MPYAFNYHFDQGIFRGLAFANFHSPAEANEVVAALNGVLAQRLVRTLCPHCKQPQPVPREDWQALLSAKAVRGSAAHDGRRAHIAPTATAVGESRERFTALNAAIDAVLERHDPAEIESVHTVLAELLDAVRAANDSHRALARDGSAVRT